MKIKIISFFVTALLIGSCAKSDIPYYEGGAEIDFLYSAGRSFKYTFLNNLELKEFTYKVPVKIVGKTADYDREVKIKVIADSTTAKSSDYQIVESIVKANEFYGYIAIKFINQEILKTETLHLWIELDQSKDFNKGNIENRAFELLWDNRMAAPANWRYYGFGDYSTTIHKFMITVLGVSYLEYGSPDDPAVPNLSSAEIRSYQGKMRTALREYNKQHKEKPLRHEDGVKVDELVVIP